MALIEIRRRCDECDKTRAALAEVHHEIERIRLDYLSLYEKARTTLTRLAKREERANTAQESTPPGDGDPLAQYRQVLIERRLKR